LHQIGSSVATGDMLVEPCLHGVSQVHGLATEMDPGQTMLAFEVLADVPMVSGTADLADAEEPNQFFFGHDGGTKSRLIAQSR